MIAEDRKWRLERTIEVWSQRAGRQLTEDDAQEITRNMVGFFRVLLEWSKRSNSTPRVKAAPLDALDDT